MSPVETTEPLAVETLLDAARAETGLEDFGDEAFLVPLSRYISSVSTEAGLGPMGREVLCGDTIRLLSNRLRLQADLVAHPEIVEEEVDDPIVITGLARTGTTKVQRALSADPATQSLPFWRAMSPGRLPNPEGGPDPRIALGEMYSAGLDQAGPDFQAAHTMSTHEAEEDTLLLQMSFDRSSAFTWYYHAPTYFREMEGRDQVPAYGYVRHVLKHLQWQDGGRRGRPWVLKSPVHLGNLDAILEVFPRATVVHCHRRIDVAQPSLCRLVETIRPARGVVESDLFEIGEFFTRLQSEACERNLAHREAAPASARIIDIEFDQIAKDIGSIARGIYENHGLEMTPEGLAAIEAWERANPPHQRGRHVYTMERYGLTNSGLRAAFARYLEAFPSAEPLDSA